MGAMNDFERTIVKHYSDGPDAVATCPAGHEMFECQVEQFDERNSVERWWVAAPVGSEFRGWANENSKWEEFVEMGVYVWDYPDGADYYAWIVPATREPYRGEVRTA